MEFSTGYLDSTTGGFPPYETNVYSHHNYQVWLSFILGFRTLARLSISLCISTWSQEYTPRFSCQALLNLISHGGMSQTISHAKVNISLSFNHPKSTANTTMLRFNIHQFILSSFIGRLQDLLAFVFFSHSSVLGDIDMIPSFGFNYIIIYINSSNLVQFIPR